MESIRLQGRKGSYSFYSGSAKNSILEHGRFGILYKGIEENNGQEIAIKMLNPIYANDKIKTMRFKLEAALTLNHAGVVRNIDFVKQDENYYLIQEFVHGITLKSLKSNSKINKHNKHLFFAKVMIRVLEALEYVHLRNVFHRDLKPSNIMIINNKNGEIDFENPEIKLIDFGLARVRNIEVKAENLKRIEFPLMYSSPEQLLNFNSLINSTSDIYMLGMTMYELFAGKLPFNDDIPAKILNLQIATNIPACSAIPAPIMKIIAKASAKETFAKPPSRYSNLEIRDILIRGQELRYQSAREMREAILAIVPELDYKKVQKKSFFRKFFIF